MEFIGLSSILAAFVATIAVKEVLLIKHIVLWKLKDEAEGRDRKGNASEMKRRLEALKSSIPGILDLEVGLQFEPNEAAHDLALYSVFKDKAALAAYMGHPEHLKVVEFVRKVVSDRKVVDYETTDPMS